MRVYKAPEHYELDENDFSIFLGGSIEMGKAEDWQTRLTNLLASYNNVVILNPRRDDWDSSWVQDPTPGTKFYEQVDWELCSQDAASLLVYYFDPETKSPITLLELGSYGSVDPRNVIVCCPDGFWRKGNVVMFCNHNFVKMVENFDDLVKEIITRVEKHI